MFVDALRAMPRKPYRLKLVVEHMEFFGNKSIMIILLISFFTGMVFGLQCYIGFNTFGADFMAGSIVAMAMVRELGPMLTAIMLAARVGSAITAEIGTMRITEQIDALESMAIDPVHYLVVPRIIAGAIVAPLLNGIFIFCGLFGGYVINVLIMGVNETLYYNSSIEFTTAMDIFHSSIKAFIFGIVVMVISCYYGLTTKHGATGVAKATTQSVVESAVIVLMFDYIITTILVS